MFNLNGWGLRWPFGADEEERFKLLRDYLRKTNYDFVLLQEVWYLSQIYKENALCFSASDKKTNWLERKDVCTYRNYYKSVNLGPYFSTGQNLLLNQVLHSTHW